jgi:peptide/nickel transport system substrate-binding protein
MKRVVSGISTFLLLMMIFTLSVVSLPMGAGSKDSRMVTVYGENEATPKYGGTLRIGEPSYEPLLPSTLNPLLGRYYYYCSLPFFNSLLTYDENCSLQPELAESYETSEDGLNVTFHLYENVSWHDGVEFNASDVKFTFDTVRDDPNVLSAYKDYALSIDSTEVIGAFTVVFHLNEHWGCIPQYLSFFPIIPKHIYEGTDLTTNPANQNPIGTGPFKFENWTPETNLTVTANEEYFRGRPYLDSIFYRWDIPRTELAVALENNVIDVVSGGFMSGGDVDPSKIQDLQDTTGTSVAAKEAAAFWCIWLNMSSPVLQSGNVRQAIAHAINKTKIITEAFCGYASAAKGPLPPSLQEWCNPNVADYEFNETLAEELLDQECPRAPDGWRFSLVIKTVHSSLEVPWEANALYTIRDDLISVGINASIQFGTPISEFSSGNFDAFLIGWGYDALGPDDLYDIFHSDGMVVLGNYHNSTLDALLEEGKSSFNETLRKMDFDRAQEIIAQDLPMIFLYHPYVAAAYNSDFHGRFLSTPPVNGRLTPYFLKEIWYDPTLRGKGNCPYRVCFTDSEGRRTGYHDGTAYEDIPDSTYSGVDSEPQVVKVREPAGIYTVELVGTENSSYKFEFANIALDYKDVWIPEGFIHENETITYIVKVYGDGSIKVYDQDEFSSHDLGMRSISASKTVVGQDYTADLNATVFNWGDYTEHFNITFYANTTVIGTVIDVVILSGETATKSFTWDTTGFAMGNYNVTICATPVSGETDTTDNNLTGGWVLVTIPGDVDGDLENGRYDVDLYDAVRLLACYGAKQGEPNFDINCDIDNSGQVFLFDAVILLSRYGEKYP